MILKINQNGSDIKSAGIVLLVISISILVLYSPYLLRELKNNEVPLGTYSYYHMKIIDSVLRGNNYVWDDKVFEGRLIQINLFHLLMAKMIHGENLEQIALFVPPLFGIMTLILFYFILRRISLSETHILFTLLVLTLSSNFIYPFVSFSPSFFAIFLFVLGLFLYSFKKTWTYILSILIFVMISLIGNVDSIMALLILFAFHLLINEGAKRYVLLCGMSLVALITFNVPFILFRGFPEFSFEINYGLITKMFSEFGGIQGYNILILLLALLGVFILWRMKKHFLPSYLIILVCFVISIFYIETASYMSFIFAILSGITIKELSYRKWNLDLIKNLTMLLMICTLVFSIVSYLILFSAYPPNKGFVRSLESIRGMTDPEGTFLSHPDNGFWVEEIANRRVLLDNDLEYIKNTKQKQNDTMNIFNSRNLETTKSLLDKYYIKYILIEPSMFDGKVWYEKDEGLTFLFRDNETFKNIYNKNGVEVWEFLR